MKSRLLAQHFIVNISKFQLPMKGVKSQLSRYFSMYMGWGVTLESGRAQAIKYFGARHVKNHWFAWRANQWPLIGETLFSSIPSAIPQYQTLEGLFEMTRVPFKGPQPRRVRCFVIRRRGPRRNVKNNGLNIECAFVENTLVFVVSKIGELLGPPWPPWLELS